MRNIFRTLPTLPLPCGGRFLLAALPLLLVWLPAQAASYTFPGNLPAGCTANTAHQSSRRILARSCSREHLQPDNRRGLSDRLEQRPTRR